MKKRSDMTYYNLVASTDEVTVVAEYTPEYLSLIHI